MLFRLLLCELFDEWRLLWFLCSIDRWKGWCACCWRWWWWCLGWSILNLCFLDRLIILGISFLTSSPDVWSSMEAEGDSRRAAVESAGEEGPPPALPPAARGSSTSSSSSSPSMEPSSSIILSLHPVDTFLLHVLTLCWINLTMSERAKTLWQTPHVRRSWLYEGVLNWPKDPVIGSAVASSSSPSMSSMPSRQSGGREFIAEVDSNPLPFVDRSGVDVNKTSSEPAMDMRRHKESRQATVVEKRVYDYRV